LTEVPADPNSEFQAYHYLRHNQRRLEHLATLGLPLAGRTVIELGAGIGDHTGFFLDRGCSVLTSDGRKENYEILRQRWSWIDVRLLDLDDPDPDFHEVAEVVYCYGTLYHLSRPSRGAGADGSLVHQPASARDLRLDWERRRVQLRR
jgi:hypothetical protein